MPGQQLLHAFQVRVVELDRVDELGVEASPLQIEYPRDATRQARRDVAAGRAEEQRLAARHVLAGVVAHTLDDRRRTGVADAEALAHDAAKEDLPRRGAVPDDVSRDDLLLGGEGGLW